MKTNNITIFILAIVIFLAAFIISIFTFFCETSDNLTNEILFSSIFSIVLFIVVFILEKKLLFKEYESKQELKKERNKINYTDSLTSLPNRKKFFEDLEDAKGIILIDLDDFYLLNTIYSKEFGDEFLRKLSHKLLQSSCIDNLYRMGGDEFTFISKKEQDLKSVAECLLKVISDFYIIKDNIMIQTTATLAVTYSKPFIETADLALKYGKKNKLNLVVYSNSLNIFEENKAFLDVTMRLKKALKTNNIVPFFQCIKDKNEKIVKYEALMRIKDGEKYILPAVFLDIAKKTKIYPELTIHMVNKTFEYMKNKDIKFSFNLSYDDIINKRIYNFILDKIDSFDKKENIIVELLETERVGSFAYIKKFIDEIHKRGAKVAIDDFGSGYSNFVYLEKLNVDIIKIDGEIVSEILLSDNAMFLVRTIVEFCKKNNIVSVAEYVSHREIYNVLKEIGVDEYQGFYFCKPKERIE